MNSEPEEESTTSRLMGLVREEWEAPLRARIAVLEKALRAVSDYVCETSAADLTGALRVGEHDRSAQSPQARIDAALAVMDHGFYGDPGVPFRMRDALVEGQS